MSIELALVLLLLSLVGVCLYYRNQMPNIKESVVGTANPAKESPMKPFLLVTRYKGAFACKHCAMAIIEISRLNSRLRNPIEVLYLEDNLDPRVNYIIKHFKGKVPSPVLYNNGQILVGTITPWHTRGMFEGFMGVK